MQGITNGCNQECLLQLLDITKKAAYFDNSDLDDEPDETISSEDAKIDMKKIDFNTAEIQNLYVSLIV